MLSVISVQSTYVSLGKWKLQSHLGHRVWWTYILSSAHTFHFVPSIWLFAKSETFIPKNPFTLPLWSTITQNMTKKWAWSIKQSRHAKNDWGVSSFRKLLWMARNYTPEKKKMSGRYSTVTLLCSFIINLAGLTTVFHVIKFWLVLKLKINLLCDGH